MIDLSKIQEAKKLLKQYFGYDEFRQGQEQLIEAALNGQDVLGIMPTGAGLRYRALRKHSERLRPFLFRIR